MDYVELGRRVRDLRRQRGWTQEQLAEQVGVCTSYIGHIERGTRTLSLETFATLCSVLQAEPNDLLYAAGSVSGAMDHLTDQQRQEVRLLLQYACRLVQP